VRLAPPSAVVWRRDGRFVAPEAWPAALCTALQRYPCADGSAFFAAAAEADLVRSRDALLLRLGYLRRRGGSRLDAQSLLEEGLATPRAIDSGAIEGSGSVVALDLRAPRLAAYSTLLGTPRLEYLARDGELVLASEPKLLVPFVADGAMARLTEPQFVLTRCVTGEASLLEGVRRLGWGRVLLLDSGRVSLGARRTLADLTAGSTAARQVDDAALAEIERTMRTIVGHWRQESDALGGEWRTLLSGGLDSSILQRWVVEAAAPQRCRTVSFSIQAREFSFEVDYAREAAARLGCDHQVVAIAESEYPSLLRAAVETLGEPGLMNESLPGFLRLARAIADDERKPSLLLTGSGADGLHGNHTLVAFEIVQRMRRLPAGRGLLGLAAGLGGRPARVASAGRWIDWLGDTAPAMGMGATVEEALRWFGAETVREVVDARLALVAELEPEEHSLDRAMVVALVSSSIEPSLAISRMFAAAGLDVAHPYLDEGAIGAVRHLPVGERYLRPGWSLWRRVKPVQNALLERSGLGALAGRRKGGGLFTRDLVRWLGRGELRDMVHAIERPAWLPKRELELLLERPTSRLWTLLQFDLYRRWLRSAGTQSVVEATA